MSASPATLAEFDPLQRSVAPSTPPSSSASPLSFKRRTPSRVPNRATGLLGGILQQSDPSANLLDTPTAPAPSPPRRVLTDDEPDHQDESTGQRTPTNFTRNARVSFGHTVTRPPRLSRWEDDNPSLLSPKDDYPTLSLPLQVVSNPLPTLPILVLCIAMFSEFLSASTAGPFLFFLLESFGVGQGENGGGEAAVGFWCGIVGASFFLSQFLTSLLWVSIAQKHGRRAVLLASLLGNAVTLAMFGTSKNLATAISIRLLQGVFNGAIGVARGAVQNITDPTNEQRAFLYIGLCWGMGGIVGSIIGGLLEHPVQNFPFLFGNSTLFLEYPYLLPCLISSSVTFTGAILSLFLSPDGGPRTGGIHLPTEKDVESAASVMGQLPRRAAERLSTYFNRRNVSGTTPSPSDRVPMHRSSTLSLRDPASLPEPINSVPRHERNPLGAKQAGYGTAYGYNPLSMSRTSTRQSGSAYGLGEGRRRNFSRPGVRSTSAATSTRYAPDYDDIDHGELPLNFAQRLLLANEAAVFSLSDLWVARATQDDDRMTYREEEEEQDENVESVFEDDESRVDYGEGDDNEPDFFGFGTAPPSLEDLRGTASRQANLGEPYSMQDQLATVTSPMSLQIPDSSRRYRRSPSRVVSGSSARRSTSIVRSPAIFANSGLNPASAAPLPSPALCSPSSNKAPLFSPAVKLTNYEDSSFNPMEPIPERSPAQGLTVGEESMVEEEKAVSLMSQLPLALISQYALLALHCTTCDQVFMSFLVTPIAAGGLGLKAANYAMLVATMFFFSGIWQFLFYPRASAFLSHLGLFRLGLSLYLPIYLLFPSLRGLIREDGNSFLIMFGMTILSSIRYLGNALCYTAMSILINATTPPHLVPFANGLAQSAVSLARFIGPIAGGTIWAYSISGTTEHVWPLNYSLGFSVTACVCAIGLLFSFRIR